DGSQPAADDDGARRELIARAIVGFLGIMVEPVNQRILVDEAFIDEPIRALDWKRTIAPCAMGEHQDVEAPVGPKILEIDVAPQPAAGDELDVRMFEALVDLLVLVFALLDVPSRQTILDFPVGAKVLLKDDDECAALRQYPGDLGSRGRCADHRYDMTRLITRCHKEGSISYRLRRRFTILHLKRAFLTGWGRETCAHG